MMEFILQVFPTIFHQYSIPEHKAACSFWRCKPGDYYWSLGMDMLGYHKSAVTLYITTFLVCILSTEHRCLLPVTKSQYSPPTKRWYQLQIRTLWMCLGWCKFYGWINGMSSHTGNHMMATKCVLTELRNKDAQPHMSLGICRVLISHLELFCNQLLMYSSVSRYISWKHTIVFLFHAFQICSYFFLTVCFGVVSSILISQNALPFMILNLMHLTEIYIHKSRYY